ncbi:MAG: VCBS repeat-containing protein, partial [Planctomycetales bacterium]|nr:VCBS repeat-containing protein [Planctomycetales bacterium]
MKQKSRNLAKTLRVDRAARLEVLEARRLLAVRALQFDGPELLTTSHPSVWVEVADFDNDGALDIASSNSNGSDEFRIEVMHGRGDGTFDAPVGYSLDSLALQMVVADFNSDGFQDLAVPQVNGSVRVLVNQGDGSFAIVAPYAVGADASAIAAADVNEDGAMDLIVSAFAGSGVWFLLGDGVGGFAPQANLSSNSRLWGVAAEDFNNDAHVDLVIAKYDTHSVEVLAGAGDGSFTTLQEFAAGVGPAFIDVEDFNNDDVPDLAVADWDGGSLELFVGDGAGSFSAAASLPGGGIVNAATAQDVNADGFVDLLFSKVGANSVGVYLNNGSATGNVVLSSAFEVQPDLTPGGDPRRAAVGDLNGDGSVDLVVATNVAPDVAVYLQEVNIPPAVVDQSFSVVENSPSGSFVGVVAASDGNVGDVLSYSIVEGSGALAIDSATGVLSVADASQLDFESNPQLFVTIAVTDGALIDTAQITVDLTDTVTFSDPIAWYKGELDSNDHAGHLNGFSQGNLTFTDGVVGRAMSFDGASAVHILKRDETIDSAANRGSIEAWVRTAPGFNGNGTVLSNYGGAEIWGLGIADGKAVLSARDGNLLVAHVVGTTSVDDGQWHHLAGVMETGQFKVYVDGVLDATTPEPAGFLPLALTNSYVRIGGSNTGPGHSTAMTANEAFFVGAIDELSVYSYALSADEIQEIVAVGAAGKPLPGPTAEFLADGNADDAVGLNHGAIQGNVQFVPSPTGTAFSFD